LTDDFETDMNDIPCTYRISVKAAITDEKGRVMLVRDKDGSWELPGGGLEHGEDPRTALVREIAEETGLTVDWMSDKPAAFWTLQKEVGSPTIKWFAFVVYAAEVSGAFRSDPTSDESQEARYFSMDEAKALPLHDNSRPYFQ
jgi:ADP-ribose pyrophosphatase YjhB (NUDIX family)